MYVVHARRHTSTAEIRIRPGNSAHVADVGGGTCIRLAAGDASLVVFSVSSAEEVVTALEGYHAFAIGVTLEHFAAQALLVGFNLVIAIDISIQYNSS